MTVAHKNLTGSDIHETKGITGASADTVHVRVSAGTSGWAKINKNNIDSGSIKNTNIVLLNVRMADISTPGAAYVVAPFDGTIKAIYSVIDGTISGADTIITPKLGVTAMTTGAITIAFSGSAAGDVDSSTPTGNNSVVAGQAIVLESDGGSTGTVAAEFTLVLELA